MELDLMLRTPHGRRAGFVLIEALVALLIIAFGLVAISRLQALSIFGSGDAKSRSEAMALSQSKLVDLRNQLEKSKFTGAPMADGTANHAGTNASYAMTWTVTTPSGGMEQRLLQLTTTWENSQGVSQRLDLNSVIAWDGPFAQGQMGSGLGGSIISPTGQALRPTSPQTKPGQSGVYTDGDHFTYLLDGAGKVLLYLKPAANGDPQSFATITGKVFIDQGVGNKVPSSANLRVRLSSEGECTYDNAANNLVSVTGGSNSYKYFTYKCYVGPGWYGNVGILVDDSVNGSAANPAVCVGDPAYNGGQADSTLVAPYVVGSNTRSYRGFKGSPGAYLSTGMSSGSNYGKSYAPDGTALTGPFDGRTRPSAYPSSYSVTAGSALDYFEQNFLVTSVNGQNVADGCEARMAGGVFARTAGKYVCINPDNEPGTDVCPSIWPGFEGEVGSGGVTTYALNVTTSGSGSVASDLAGISCGSVCAASYVAGTTVTLTAVPTGNATFSGWTGCTSASGLVCTVNMNAAAAVTATFGATAPNDSLTVSKSGTGSGLVTSSPSGINCGSTCTSAFSAGTAVTLTATPSAGATFAGWTGAGCSGTATCSVTISGAATVVANFTASVTYALSVTKSGTGTGSISSSPAGISGCTATCSASYGSGTQVTLTPASASGSTFSAWGGACSAVASTSNCTVTMDAAKNVTGTFTLNTVCNTPISGVAHDSHGSVAASVGGACNMANGNVTNYSCSLSLPAGTMVTLTNERTTGNASDQYSYTIGPFAANCSALTKNFP
jgi:Tfp pilus assembly protein PilV